MRFEGKTVEDATATACIKLEKTLKELKVKVIDNGKKGFLGIGSKPAIIEVSINGNDFEEVKSEVKVEKKVIEKSDNNSYKVEKISEEKNEKFSISEDVKEYLQSMLKLMGIENVNIEYSIDEEKRNANFSLNADENTAKKIIGKRGLILDSIQNIVNVVFSNRRSFYWIKLDVDNYRDKRHKTIEALAYRSANTVKKYKRRVVLDNLSSNERRIIHSVLKNDNRIDTFSEGREPNRKLIISLRRNRTQY